MARREEHAAVEGIQQTLVSLKPESLPALQAALERADLDGWLLYDFHGLNPVAVGMLELPGMTTRRFFASIPRRGEPVGITHTIEHGPWGGFPTTRRKEKNSRSTLRD